MRTVITESPDLVTVLIVLLLIAVIREEIAEVSMVVLPQRRSKSMYLALPSYPELLECTEEQLAGEVKLDPSVSPSAPYQG